MAEKNGTEKQKSRKERKWLWCKWCGLTNLFILINIFRQTKIWRCEMCGGEKRTGAPST